MEEKNKNISSADKDNCRFERIVMQPFYEDETIKIYNENFESVLPQLKEKPDVIITDPPYPDYYVDEYKYYEGLLNFLADYDCRQLIFWSARTDFPLDYCARHRWLKFRGFANIEYIYERNGGGEEYNFKYQKLNNIIDAQMNRDILTGHDSQKPIRLMKDIINKFTIKNDLILDTFMGSGSTLAAAKKLGRQAIGIEINKNWCEVAVKRLSQMELF